MAPYQDVSSMKLGLILRGMVQYKRKMEVLGYYPRIYDYYYGDEEFYDDYSNVYDDYLYEQKRRQYKPKRKLYKVFLKPNKTKKRKSKSNSKLANSPRGRPNELIGIVTEPNNNLKTVPTTTPIPYLYTRPHIVPSMQTKSTIYPYRPPLEWSSVTEPKTTNYFVVSPSYTMSPNTEKEATSTDSILTADFEDNLMSSVTDTHSILTTTLNSLEITKQPFDYQLADADLARAKKNRTNDEVTDAKTDVNLTNDFTLTMETDTIKHVSSEFIKIEDPSRTMTTELYQSADIVDDNMGMNSSQLSFTTPVKIMELSHKLGGKEHEAVEFHSTDAPSSTVTSYTDNDDSMTHQSSILDKFTTNEPALINANDNEITRNNVIMNRLATESDIYGDTGVEHSTEKYKKVPATVLTLLDEFATTSNTLFENNEYKTIRPSKGSTSVSTKELLTNVPFTTTDENLKTTFVSDGYSTILPHEESTTTTTDKLENNKNNILETIEHSTIKPADFTSELPITSLFEEQSTISPFTTNDLRQHLHTIFESEDYSTIMPHERLATTILLEELSMISPSTTTEFSQYLYKSSENNSETSTGLLLEDLSTTTPYTTMEFTAGSTTDSLMEELATIRASSINELSQHLSTTFETAEYSTIKPYGSITTNILPEELSISSLHTEDYSQYLYTNLENNIMQTTGHSTIKPSDKDIRESSTNLLLQDITTITPMHESRDNIPEIGDEYETTTENSRKKTSNEFNFGSLDSSSATTLFPTDPVSSESTPILLTKHLYEARAPTKLSSITEINNPTQSFNKRADIINNEDLFKSRFTNLNIANTPSKLNSRRSDIAADDNHYDNYDDYVESESLTKVLPKEQSRAFSELTPQTGENNSLATFKLKTAQLFPILVKQIKLGHINKNEQNVLRNLLGHQWNEVMDDE